MTEEVVQPTLNPRALALAQIAERLEGQKAGDYQTFDEATGAVNAAEKPAEEVKETVIQEPVTDVVVQSESEVKVLPKKYSIVVDGESIEVDEEKLLDAGRRTLQKDTAADRRLAEANRLRKEAETLLRQVKPEPSSDAPQPTAQAISDETLPTLVRGIEDRVISTIDAKQAVVKFREEFPDVAKDADLWQLAVLKNQQRIDHATEVGEPLGSDLDAYRKIGEEIRKRFVPTQPAGLQEKAEKKRTITSIQAVNAKATPPQEDKPKTVSEEIEEMRQLRKQGYRTQGFARLKQA